MRQRNDGFNQLGFEIAGGESERLAVRIDTLPEFVREPMVDQEENDLALGRSNARLPQ